MINNLEELKEAWEENLEYGVVLLIEDYHMQMVSIYVSNNEEDFYGMYPYPDEDGNARTIRVEDLKFPLEVVYSDKLRLA